MNDRLAFFADENISPQLVNWLSQKKYDVDSIYNSKQFGISDEAIINQCYLTRKIILTHDSDFGRLIHTSSTHFYIIIYLKPGHFSALYHTDTINKLLKHQEYFKERTLIVASKEVDKIRIRIKTIL